MKKHKGVIIISTGDGKGKTTVLSKVSLHLQEKGVEKIKTDSWF